MLLPMNFALHVCQNAKRKFQVCSKCLQHYLMAVVAAALENRRCPRLLYVTKLVAKVVARVVARVAAIMYKTIENFH